MPEFIAAKSVFNLNVQTVIAAGVVHDDGDTWIAQERLHDEAVTDEKSTHVGELSPSLVWASPAGATIFGWFSWREHFLGLSTTFHSHLLALSVGYHWLSVGIICWLLSGRLLASIFPVCHGLKFTHLKAYIYLSYSIDVVWKLYFFFNGQRMPVTFVL